MTAGRLAHPAYLPAAALPLLPWTDRHCRQLAGRFQVSVEDLWDEAVAALIRASLGYDATNGARFSTYACTAVKRACLKVVGHWSDTDRTKTGRRPLRFIRHQQHTVPLDEAALTTDSPEAIVLAHEAVGCYEPDHAAPPPSRRSAAS